MKAISLHPVWAWAVIHGPKRVENRTWATRHRGPLVIHAGRGNKRADAEARAALEAIGAHVPQDVPRSVLLGVVDLVDVVRTDGPGRKQQTLGGILPDHDLPADPLATGPICWILADPRPLAEPVPCHGQQGLWTADLADRAF